MSNKRRYRLPIQGTVLKMKPLKGLLEDPIRIIDLTELPNYPIYGSALTERQSCKIIYLNYNIDEEWCEVELTASKEFHAWLADILPQLRDIQKEKGWKLDKSKVVEK